MNSQLGSRFVILDTGRVFAISLVLLSHIAYTLKLPIYRLVGIPGLYYTTVGGIGVTFFLILSGISLGLKYSAVDSYWLFVGKRLWKIYLTYWLAIAAAVAVYSIAQSRLVMPDVLSITGFAAFAGKWGGFIPTAWFIGLIVSLYLLYPFLARIIKSYAGLALIVLLLVSMTARLCVGHLEWLPTRAIDWLPLCRLFEFGLGIYLGHRLSSRVWLAANRGRVLNGITGYAGELSFPLFLIHYPLLGIITAMPWGLPVFLLASIAISAAVLKVSQAIVTPSIFRRGN